MAAGWRTLGAVLAKALLWGIGTSAVSFVLALAVFLFVVPRLIDAPDLAAPTFAVLMGYGGLFIGLLLGLLLQISDVLPLSPWHQAAHIVAVLVVAALAWSSTDVALDPSYLAERVSEPVAEHTPRS